MAAYPVIEDGRVVGVISPGVAAAALEEGRCVAEVMVRKEEAVVLAPEIRSRRAMRRSAGIRRRPGWC